MRTSASEGLGLSVVIYMAAVLGVLGLVVVPVYLANAPQVYENPTLARANPLLDGPIIGNRAPHPVPLAMLKRQTIVDPAIVAGLNAKAKQVASARVTRPTSTPRPRGTPVAELQPERPRHSFFLFNLFGG
jgi:hypothetical protein